LQTSSLTARTELILQPVVRAAVKRTTGITCLVDPAAKKNEHASGMYGAGV